MKADCPMVEQHTAEPTGYVAWHEWAERMSETHRQVKCKGCGLYAIWVPKKEAALQAATPDGAA